MLTVYQIKFLHKSAARQHLFTLLIHILCGSISRTIFSSDTLYISFKNFINNPLKISFATMLLITSQLYANEDISWCSSDALGSMHQFCPIQYHNYNTYWGILRCCKLCQFSFLLQSNIFLSCKYKPIFGRVSLLEKQMGSQKLLPLI